MGRESTKSRTSTFGEISNLALNGYMLVAKTELVCLAMQQFGAFMLMLHIREINSVRTPTLGCRSEMAAILLAAQLF